MVTYVAPNARQSSYTSLEDDLAEATQELLDLGRSEAFINHGQNLNVDLHLSTPSPFVLSRPGSTNKLDVGKALSIDSNARLTPIHDGFDKIQTSSSMNPSIDSARTIKDGLSAMPLSSSPVNSKDSNLPSSQLHKTIKSVTSNLLSPPIRNAGTASPGLQVVQDSIRENSWLNEHGERISSQGKVERRMELLQNRIYPSSAGPSSTTLSKGSSSMNPPYSANPTSHNAMRQEFTPAFFLESFPDAIKTNPIADKKEYDLEEKGSESQDSVTTATITSSSSNLDPIQFSAPRLRSIQPSAAMTTETSVTVKLHGNRRAEREAMMLGGGEVDDENVSFNQEVTTYSSDLSSSPIQEIDPRPTGEDSSSLISLPATTVTSSSQTSSAQRRRSVRRRRSTGGQSYLTGSSAGEDGINGGEYPIYPFARDVNIRGFSIVGEKARGYVAYDVRIITRNGSTISVLRRFSAFVNLRKALMDECYNTKAKIKRSSVENGSGSGGTSNNLTTSSTGGKSPYNRPLPPLPPKRTGILQKYASDHLEKRRRALQKWLTIVMLDSLWGTSRAIRQWVVGNDEDV